MISCQEADIFAAALSVGSVDAHDQPALQQHYSSCADCRRAAGEYLAAAARLPLALEPRRPSPDLRGQLMRAVYAETQQAAGRAAAAASTTTPWQRLWNRIPAARGFTAVAAGAVAALFAVSSWAVVDSQRAGFPSVAVAITASSAAPLAQGQLVYGRGSSEAILTVTGLPAPSTVASGAAVYEVWLVGSDGVSRAVAYLSHEPDGSWSAAVHGDLTRYSMVAATAEPHGGSPAPAGARVIEAVL